MLYDILSILAPNATFDSKAGKSLSVCATSKPPPRGCSQQQMVRMVLF